MSSKKQSWANAHSQLWTSPVPRSTGSRTQSEVSSIASPNRDRSLLDDTDTLERANDLSMLSRSHINSSRPKEKTLVQVSDILESYGTISQESDIPAVLLTVVKELEEAKRENNFKDMVMREYSEVVRRRFCLYGEEAPPSASELSKRLRDGGLSKPLAAPAPIWLDEPLCDLRRLIEEESQLCYGESIDFSLPTLLPDASHTRLNVSQIVQKGRELLVRLANEHREAKKFLTKKLNDGVDAKEKQTPLTLTEALTELDARQALDVDNAAHQHAAENEKSNTFRAALQSIIESVPASLQIHFQLQNRDAPVLTQCENLEHLLQFLLSEYLSMERYMEEVEQQRCELARVFRLPSINLDSDSIDSAAQIDDALTRSLGALKKTVTAVVTFPHQISEEELALRRATAEAVDELAQLLVEARPSAATASGTPGPHSAAGSAASMVRIEPPTRNLLEMVEMVKSRFATLLAQQQRKELVGAQSRVGFAHMEEAMRSQGKQILQLLREMCTMQDDGVAAEQVEALSELMGGVDVERNLTPAKLDFFLSDVGERLRLVKTRYQRALNAAASNKTRADAAGQKCAAAQKKLHKIAVCVERLGTESLGLTFPSTFANSTSNGGGVGGADGDEMTGKANPVAAATADSEGGRGDGVSTLRRLNLRPAPGAAAEHKAAALPSASSAAAAATATSAAVTEANVLDALQFLAARLSADDVLRDQLKAREEVDQLRRSEARWKADTAAFREAMAMLMRRLASNGQLVKQSLFMMGTDESAKDDVVEEVLRRGDGSAGQAEDAEAEAEYVERSLAELLQKYTRWAQRLQQTTEDHLYTQRKIVKYFAAVRRFFTSQGSRDDAAAGAALPPPAEDIPDDNLYDIDSCLMRAADVILPALDAAIQGVEGRREARAKTSSSTAGGAASSPPPPPSSAQASSPTRPGSGDRSASPRQDAIAQLVRDSAAAAAGGVLPYDHRIARLYETVARLYTAVTSLMQVHYLSIPSGVRRRSSGGDVELLFDGEAAQDGFVDIDLDRLIRVSQRRSGKGESAEGGAEGERFAREGAAAAGDAVRGPASPPPSTVAANNDVILRVTYQNMEVLQDTLKRFSANHKMAAIVLQKDMDAVQQQLAAMLEKYSEVDMEAAFHQSREELHELYVTLRDRAQVQKGCYFFNRVGGEGTCTWVTALEQLREGFCGVVDRLVQRTAQAAESRELTDEVVDLCAMYVNWAERHALPPSHSLTPELLALCLRDGKSAAVAAAQASPPSSPAPPSPASSAVATAVQRPPKPSSTPPLTPRDTIKQQQQQQEGQAAESREGEDDKAEPKVSCFVEDRAVLKVMQHMFQLAQYAAEHVDNPVAVEAKAQTVPADAAGSTPAAAAAVDVSGAETRAHQLSEEMSLLREAVAVAERHVDELEEAKSDLERQRDQAQSEAAVARAELRRWKRQQQQQQQPQQQVEAITVTPQRLEDIARPHSTHPRSPRQTPPPSSASDADAAAGMDEATVREVMAYMKLLSEELQSAKQRAGAAPATPSSAEGAHSTPSQPPPRQQWRRRGSAKDRDGFDDELVRSPFSAELNGAGGGGSSGGVGAEAPRSHFPSTPSRTPSLPNRYAALAEEVRHRYGGASLAPLVVVDPASHYGEPAGHHHAAGSFVQQPQQRQRRYSPVQFRGAAYDACDRYYARELAEGEGRRGAEQMQRRGGGHQPSPATCGGGYEHVRADEAGTGDEDNDLYAVAPPPPRLQQQKAASSSSTLRLPRTQTPQRHTAPRRSSAATSSAEVHYDTYFDDRLSSMTGRRSLGRPAGAATATATTPQRYPRSLTRDAPLRGPLVDHGATPSRVYQAPQRATPVVPASSPAHAAREADEAAARAARWDGEGSGREQEQEQEEEVFYDDAPWNRRAPASTSAAGASSSSATRRRHRTSSHHSSCATPRSTSPGASSASLSHSSRPGPPTAHDLSANLAAAVQQIEAATHRGGGGHGGPTPTRRGTAHARHRHEAGDAGTSGAVAAGAPPPPPESTQERVMNQNANLRSTALRRLAEVVARTKVTPPRGARF